MDGVLEAPLNVPDGVSAVALVPALIEVLGHEAKLDDKVAGKVLRLDLAAFFLPNSD